MILLIYSLFNVLVKALQVECFLSKPQEWKTPEVPVITVDCVVLDAGIQPRLVESDADK